MRRNWRKAKPIVVEKKFLSNDKITASMLNLVNEEGINVGIIETAKALDMAKESGLDLVEVNPLAEPPVAKILNLGQFKYEQDKKAHRQKVQQKKVELKSIRMTFRISAHDLEIRKAQAIKFLQKDNKVKIDLLLRGREKQHFDRAREMMLEFTGDIKATEGLVVEDENPLTRQPSGFTITLISKK